MRCQHVLCGVNTAGYLKYQVVAPANLVSVPVLNVLSTQHGLLLWRVSFGTTELSVCMPKKVSSGHCVRWVLRGTSQSWLGLTWGHLCFNWRSTRCQPVLNLCLTCSTTSVQLGACGGAGLVGEVLTLVDAAVVAAMQGVLWGGC